MHMECSNAAEIKYSLVLLVSSPLPLPSEPEPDLVDSVRGVLLMQDIQLGVLMALLPFFEGGASETDPSPSSRQPSGVFWLLQLLQVLFGLPAVVLLLRSLATRLVGRFYRYVHGPFTDLVTFDLVMLFDCI